MFLPPEPIYNSAGLRKKKKKNETEPIRCLEINQPGPISPCLIGQSLDFALSGQ